ncbi:MAG: TonB-dependent receptor [Saprospiraceae bacterium]|nr:TonB-dependent receptor [Saprospiraceae bacterium]
MLICYHIYVWQWSCCTSPPNYGLRYIITYLFVLCLHFLSFAQSDSLNIDTITIKSVMVACCNENKQILNQHNQNILSLPNNWYIKSNGPGGVSTLSLRGGSSSQNNTFWNDVPINNPMLGLNDLTLLPLGIIESLTISKSGNTGSKGQGSLSGSVSINTHDPDPAIAELTLMYGSFGHKQINLQTDLEFGKIKWQSKLFILDADNDFSYALNGGSDQKLNSNADFNSKGTIQTLSFRPNTKHTLELNYWWQKTDRGIPPLSTQTTSLARQYDDQQRVNFVWRYLDNNFKLYNSFAYIDEHNDYADPQIMLNANNQFKRWYHHVELKKNLGEFSFALQNQSSYAMGKSDSYSDQNTLKSVSPMISIGKQFRRTRTQFILRKEWSNLTDAPISPTLIINTDYSNGLSSSFKLSKEYRLPTLNELFWRPGGNSDIRPESGWNQELTIGYKPSIVYFEIGLYHRLINDWILWTLNDGSFFFAVENITQVRSYGTDITLKAHKKYNTIDITTHFNYAYTRSFSEMSINAPSIEKGQQLIYIPEHTATANIQADFSNSSLSFLLSYTGAVRGINEMVEDYLIANIYLDHTLNFHRHKVKAGLAINNLLGSDYRIVERRPMPGRHFNLFIKTSFN